MYWKEHGIIGHQTWKTPSSCFNFNSVHQTLTEEEFYTWPLGGNWDSKANHTSCLSMICLWPCQNGQPSQSGQPRGQLPMTHVACLQPTGNSYRLIWKAFVEGKGRAAGLNEFTDLRSHWAVSCLQSQARGLGKESVAESKRQLYWTWVDCSVQSFSRVWLFATP